METVLLHTSSFLCVTPIFRLSSFGSANALLTGVTKTFIPFYSSFPEIFYKLEGEDKFKTVSKLKRKANGEKIKVGRYYDLKLEKFFPRDSIFGIAIAPNLGIRGFDYGGKTVYIEQKSHNSIYRAKNLKGLYLDNELNR